MSNIVLAFLLLILIVIMILLFAHFGSSLMQKFNAQKLLPRYSIKGDISVKENKDFTISKFNEIKTIIILLEFITIIILAINLWSMSSEIQEKESEINYHKNNTITQRAKIDKLESTIAELKTTSEPTTEPISESTPKPTSPPQASHNIGNSTSGYEFKNNYVTTNTLSLAKYEKLRKGMTYEQVVNILGSNGNLVSSVDVAGMNMRGYGWYGEYGIPAIGVVFQNGVAYTIFQVGLQ